MYFDLPVSKVFSEVAQGASRGEVTFASLLARFGRDSLGLAVLVAGIVGMAPGISALSGVFLIFCALEILSGGDGATIPRFIAARTIPSRQVVYILREAQPWLEWIENGKRSGNPIPAFAKRASAIPILALSLTLFVPLPFTNVLPSAVIGAIGLACLTENRVLLGGALACAAGSLAFTIATVSAVIGAGHYLF